MPLFVAASYNVYAAIRENAQAITPVICLVDTGPDLNFEKIDPLTFNMDELHWTATLLQEKMRKPAANKVGRSPHVSSEDRQSVYPRRIWSPLQLSD